MLLLFCVVIFLLLICHGLSKQYEKKVEKVCIAIIVISILNFLHLLMLHIGPHGDFYYYLGIIKISYKLSFFLMGSSIFVAAAALVNYVYHDSY